MFLHFCSQFFQKLRMIFKNTRPLPIHGTAIEGSYFRMKYLERFHANIIRPTSPSRCRQINYYIRVRPNSIYYFFKFIKTHGSFMFIITDMDMANRRTRFSTS